jgi:protein phosphatase
MSSAKDLGLVAYGELSPQRINALVFSSYTHCGKRDNQEDRLIVAPSLLNGEYAFFGVFDGTVKEYAAEYVHKNILPCLLESASFCQFDALSDEEKRSEDNAQLMTKCLSETYAATDRKLLEWCQEHSNHYTSCTSVTVLLHLPTRRMAVAHLGDSKVILGHLEMTSSEGESEGRLMGRSITLDHKPDQPLERARIEAAGGSLTYLHGGKPFIRGGDFGQRKHAMQLNYSRAFGGKDLKMYGLSGEPDVSLVQLAPGRERMVVLGSDGIWDVIDASSAVVIAERSQHQQRSPSEELCSIALSNHANQGSADNVTAIVCFFDFADATGASAAPSANS